MIAYRSFHFVIILLLTGAGLQAQESKEIDWVYEIDLLGRELAEKHPNLFFKVDSNTFFSDLNQVAKGASGRSTFDISVQLQQVLARMGDAHTQINYHFNVDPGFILPFDCYWFEEGIFILRTTEAYAQILGKKLVSINQTSLEEVIDSLSTLIVIDNSSLLKNQVPRMITWTQLLAYFGFTDQKEVELGVMDQNGHKEVVPIVLPVKDGRTLDLETDSIPYGFRDPKAYFRDRYFPAEKVYYIQYNRCWSREVEEDYGSGASALFMPSFKEFEKEVFQVIKKNPVDKLIFDMRFNSGGNSAQGTGFIKKLCKTKMKGAGTKYVLVGRKTFSSAIINTVDFMKLGEAILVGEETGGRPNHFGDIKRFVLPESKLVVNHSTRYFKLLEQDDPSIIPQVMTPISFDQYLHGIDPALEYLFRLPAD